MTTTEAPAGYHASREAIADLRTRQLADEQIDARLRQLVAASLPGIDVPDETRFEAPGFDGVWRETTPQDALLRAGHGRPYQIVMRFPGRREGVDG